MGNNPSGLLRNVSGQRNHKDFLRNILFGIGDIYYPKGNYLSGLVHEACGKENNPFIWWDNNC